MSSIFDAEMWGWQSEAACADSDLSLFFAPNYFEKKRRKLSREAEAKKFCDECPVRSACLNYAIRLNEEHGIWGGLNEAERRSLVRIREMTKRAILAS